MTTVKYLARVSIAVPDTQITVKKSLFEEYERIVIESLISSFGLDFIINDRYGGDVDTIHNVQNIGKDPNLHYKNSLNEKRYNERGEYNSRDYHQHSTYIETNRKFSFLRKKGELTDAYTGEKLSSKVSHDLDHVVSAKEIHDDRGRVLANIKGEDLANCNENLLPTNYHTNRTKKADTMDAFLEKYGDEYTEKQKDNMRKKDRKARENYLRKIHYAYYTSSDFARDLTVAAGTLGVKMGIRQVLGLVVTEVWFSVREEFREIEEKTKFDFSKFLEKIGKAIKKGFENAKRRYKVLLEKFSEGAVSGILSSISTTLINIFFTTPKHLIRIMRHSYHTIVQAGKIIFINPDHYTSGESLRAVMQVLAVGAGVITGVMASDALAKFPVVSVIPGDILPTFFSTFLSGIMSCTLLYYLDNSQIINKIIKMLDSIPCLENDLAYYTKMAEYFEVYAASLEKIDLKEFQREQRVYSNLVHKLDKVRNENELNGFLRSAYQEFGLQLPWGENSSFDDFMRDKSSRMIFK